MSKSPFNLTPGTMIELQKELFRWQEYNFGKQEDRRMVLGICEESGELCHAHLKLEQGIRGSKSELLAEMRDAIGDISIYAMNLLSNHKEELPGISARDDVDETSSMERIGDSVLGIFCSAARIETARKTAETNTPHPHPVAPHEVPAIARHVQQLFMHLNMLCGLLGWKLEEIIRDTWGTVGKRDWKANPQDGGTSEGKRKAQGAPAPAISAISDEDGSEPKPANNEGGNDHEADDK
jgi:NTP pyrophosphatase (non-canonical NTP hydrolase)